MSYSFLLRISVRSVAYTLLPLCAVTSIGAQVADSTSQRSLSAAVAGRSPTDSLRTARGELGLVTSEAVDRLRSAQLRHGIAVGQSLLLRSASSITLPLGERGWHQSFLAPQFLAVVNSELPFSQNDGSMWAGRGLSTRTSLGWRLESPHVRLIVAPEIVVSANGDWTLFHDYYIPPLPPDRSPYDLPFYVGRFTIDQPMRFGNKRIRRLDPGQSTLMFSAKNLSLGLSNENEWWGPGIRNAIVLSNNAPGFPHLFLRTSHPWQTKLGGIDMRWLVGGLTESAFFDTTSTNNLRSLSAFALTLQPRVNPNLNVGVARSVYGAARSWNQVYWRWLDVFSRVQSNDQELADSTLARTGRDHFYSLFARWILPNDGLEIYTELARLRFPSSLRDFFTAPNHTQGYTIGLQWLAPEWRGGAFRFQTEITQLEQSATFRDRPSASWYTSTRAIQGYTNRGEVIGASIGPGASGQWAAVDYLSPGWRMGIYGARVRWNEDVHSNYGFPVYVAYCDHDISVYPGIRAAKTGRLGTLTADLALQNRLNVFFQNGGGCPNNGRRLDLRNKSLSLTYTPFQW